MGGWGNLEDAVEPVREDVEATEIVENIEGSGDMEGLEDTEDMEGLEDTEGTESGGRKGHVGCGTRRSPRTWNLRGQEGSNLDNIVILCDTYCNYTMNIASCNDI